jgi:hypothetical protein
MMEHISRDKIELYILKSGFLGDETEVIKKHLLECKECKDIYTEINGIYEIIEKEEQDRNIKQKLIHSLKRRTIPIISDYKQIFQYNKKSISGELKKIISKFFRFFFHIITFEYLSVAPKFRWAIAGAIPILLIVFIYEFYSYHTIAIFNKDKQITGFDTINKKIDSIPQKFVEIEENNEKEITDSTKIDKGENKIPKRMLFAFVPLIKTGIRGNDTMALQYKIFAVKNSYYKKTGIIVLTKNAVITTDTNNSVKTNIINKKLLHYYIIPVSEISKNYGNRINKIISIEKINSGYKIEVNETEQPNISTLYYEFDNSFVPVSIKANNNFNELYLDLQYEGKIDSNTDITEYLQSLKGQIKDIK